MSHFCEGCGRAFPLPSLRRHFAHTNKPECSAYGDSFDETTVPAFSDDIEMCEGPSFEQFDFDSEPIPFSGDFLGDGNNYSVEELGQGDGWWEDDAHDDDGGDWEEREERRFSGSRKEVNEREGVEEDEEDGELDDFDDDDLNAIQEHNWEPPRTPDIADPSDNETSTPDDGSDSTSDSDSEPDAPQQPTSSQRIKIQDRLRKPPTIVPFGGQAGQPLEEGHRENADARYREQLGDNHSFWYPFASQTDWEVARWVKLRGPGSNAFNEFLKIPGVVDGLGLSFKTTQELNKIIDDHLPGRPAFKRSEAVVAEEAFEFYHRDILECVKTLWGDPDLSPYLVFRPEHHYSDDNLEKRLYHSMHTGNWWWSTQEEVEKKHPGATIIPIIISSDKTQLTVFGNKTAYPVYMSIGNIPKEIRRKSSRGAYLLLAYLPTSKLTHIRNKSARHRALANLFHTCMHHIMAPLEKAGKKGVRVVDGVGVPRCGHPILAVYVADYPEQTLVTTAKSNRCPGLCPTDPDHLGDDHTNGPFLNLADALKTLESIAEGPTVFARKCKAKGMKPIAEPFWQNLPYTNIF
ncbi:hypothetical protein V5O48_015780, partial [Marasmius crinis-equi]